jgi:hypothetical protein
MNAMRSSRDIWFTAFCSALTSTTASVVTVSRPSLPTRASLSRTTRVMKLPLLDSRRSLIAS